MVEIPAGSFCMGATVLADEKPPHRVMISNAFYVGRFEVTQGQWRAMMGDNPSRFDGDHLPVEEVSWDDVQRFINKLNALNDGFLYRLPTEAEWEYACRAGTATAFAFGDSLSSAQANIDDRQNRGGSVTGMRREGTTAVGSFQPNAFGLYDMHGNVWEWCQDFYDYYPNNSSTDPRGPNSGVRRVLRGGGWTTGSSFARSAIRIGWGPSTRDNSHGFRAVAVARMQ